MVTPLDAGFDSRRLHHNPSLPLGFSTGELAGSPTLQPDLRRSPGLREGASVSVLARRLGVAQGGPFAGSSPLRWQNGCFRESVGPFPSRV